MLLDFFMFQFQPQCNTNHVYKRLDLSTPSVQVFVMIACLVDVMFLKIAWLHCTRQIKCLKQMTFMFVELSVIELKMTRKSNK